MAKVKNFFGVIMFKKLLSGKFAPRVLFCAVSLLAGGINGFVGTGGGILLVFALSVVLKVDKKDAFATSLCITVPVSAIALFSYFRAGSVDISTFSKIWLPVFLGGILGALLVDRIKLSWLNGIFGILIVYSGICLILR